MKDILLICVNYNSYEALEKFIESVDCSANKAETKCRVRVWIADNSQVKNTVKTEMYKHINCTYFACENDGYIGTVEKLLEKNNWSDAKETDFLIISNVDICLAKDFFCQLSLVDDNNIGWVAPRIYAKERKTEDNPQALRRYSKIKLCLLYLLYSHPLLYKIYRRTLSLVIQKKRNEGTSNTTYPQDIYAGNGSIFIFTKEFIKKSVPFHYPCFLYGEELFFAEMVRMNKLKTFFCPELYVENKTPNISTKELGYEKRCRYSAKAIKYIIQTFY